MNNTVYRRRGGAFSLVEILVVVAIIAALAGVTVMYLSKARKQAARTRQAADFQAISTALEAYKADFGDYPRAEPGQRGIAFALLGGALIAPGSQNPTNLPPTAGGTHYSGGEVVAQGANVFTAIAHNESGAAPPNTSLWAPAAWVDGADGPGFRLRNRGRVYGPYLQPEKFKVRGFALLDLWGNPILYFPARTGSVNINNNPQSFMWDSRDTSVVTTGARPLYDYADNVGMLGGDPGSTATALKADMAPILYLVGDFNPNATNVNNNGNGQIDAGETAATTGPFILWSAGPDAEDNHDFHYGLVNSNGEPDPEGKTDDVTNFDFPVGFLKK